MPYKNRFEKRKAERKRRRITVEFIAAYKKAHPCLQCGEENPDLLHFHHIDPRTKKYNISRGVNRASLNSIINEIKKCIMLCMKCHKERTAAQRHLFVEIGKREAPIQPTKQLSLELEFGPDMFEAAGFKMPAGYEKFDIRNRWLVGSIEPNLATEWLRE